MENKVTTGLHFIGIVLILVLIGFGGYYFGFLQAVYKVLMPNGFSSFGLVVLSAILGTAAFFSPCAFTVLPAYVSHYLAKEENKGKSETLSAFKMGLIAAAGLITVNMIIGLAIAILGSATPFAKDPRQDIPLILGIRAFIGFLIAGLGVMALRRQSFDLPFIQRLTSNKKLSNSMFYYGAFYNAAAIGCTGPIMLGLLLYAFSTGSFYGALTAFASFSLTMGILMVLLTTLTGIFKAEITRKFSVAGPIITKTAAIIMIVAGLSIAFLTLEGNRIFVQIFFPFLK